MSSKLRWLGPGFLILAGGCLVLLWERIPARWVTHWGVGGRADGFSYKRPLEVFLPLLIGAVFWLVLESIATLVGRNGRPPELARANAMPLRLQAVGFAASFAVLGVALPLLQPEGPLLVVGIFLLFGFGPLFAGFVHVSRVTARLRRAGHSELEGWHGVIYWNSNDTRLVVPSVTGMGHTLNLGRPAAWLAMAVLLFPAALLLLLMATLGR